MTFDEALKNPAWAALATEQSVFAESAGAVLRYRPEIAPFCGVRAASAVLAAEDIPSGQTRYLVGTIPPLPAGWEALYRASAVQMVFRGLADPRDPWPGEEELGAEQASDMVRLTGLAYPEFFRAETYRLGRYIGIRVDGELIAMAGERMRLSGPGWALCEISGVCTHPEHTGKGYASHLMMRLAERIQAVGVTPFLHTGAANARAIGVYERLGFEHTGELPLVKVRRD